MFGFIAKKIFGSVNERIIKSLSGNVVRINALEEEISALSDEQLKNKTEEFRQRLQNGQSLDDILCEAFAVVREASKRVLNMRHFDVQLIGGMILHSGRIAEMKTGEGKTVVATLPCYLNALSQKGVHVVTVNDYLAKRDSAWMGKIHQFLGLSVGCITNELDDEERKKAYDCDITYATNNELGFDYLRDNMKYSLEQMAQRKHNFAIVDEVDSILIDEARTPLIISGPTDDNSKLYEKIDRLIPSLKAQDFQIEEKERNVFLTEAGIETMEKLLKENQLIKEDSGIYDIDNISLVHHVNQALKAHKIFKNETDYIVKDDSVIIIDEFTGRMQEGRRFSDGLHQALEAKEKVSIRNENQTLASVTFQNYFRLYGKLAGMTGTASTEAVEFEEIYGLKVVEIPTNKPIARIDEDDEIYKTAAEKYRAIVKVIEDCHKRKQPILVGTISIENSEYLSKLLKKHKLPHKVLNAKYHEKEAKIIADAGMPAAITIATNMAGRGTDIKLGGNFEMLESEIREEIKDEKAAQEKIDKIQQQVEEDKKTVIEAGGLYILGTERHESRRIDNQLRGRSGRQGDPGKSKFFISLEDDLMRIFGSEKLQMMLSRLGLKDDEAIFHPWITKTLARAQNKVEMHNYEIRKNLLKYDDVINQQRKVIFEKRMTLIQAEKVEKEIEQFREEINEDIIGRNIPKNSYPEEWDVKSIESEMQRIYGLKLNVQEMADREGISDIEILNFVNEESKNLFIKRKEIYGEIELQLQKQIFLATLDEEWKDHLLSLDKLKYGINLRAYAQKDPLIEYKREAFDLFEEMMCQIEERTLSRVAHAQLKLDEERQAEIDILKQMAAKQKMSTGRVDPNMPNIEGNAQPKQMTVRTNIAPENRNQQLIHPAGEMSEEMSPALAVVVKNTNIVTVKKMKNLENIKKQFADEIASIKQLDQLEDLRIKFLGKNGLITSLMQGLKDLSLEEKKHFGSLINQLKNQAIQAVKDKKEGLDLAALNQKLATQKLDLTQPVRKENKGTFHPISQTIEDIKKIFNKLGFEFADGPEIEDDFHNFSALNIPENHPARQMQDTFYLPKDDEGKIMLLRTHTSSVQIRQMLKQKPPLKIISLGKVYRSDSDQTHTPMFHQIEALVIDKNINMGHLKWTIETFLAEFFEVNNLKTRFRPSFFPFTEPSAEIDIGYEKRNGQIAIGSDKNFLEILGCGMVHPNVLKNVDIDEKKYQGFAFGIGIERLAMLKYGITDLRMFFDGDVRFLRHFGDK